MVRAPRSGPAGPTLTKLMGLTVLLVASVLVYRKMSSIPLNLIAKQSSNRVYYEQMYSDVSNEVAYWRQRYDTEVARAEEHLKSLTKLQILAEQLQEDNESLKADVVRLQQQMKEHEGSRIA